MSNVDTEMCPTSAPATTATSRSLEEEDLETTATKKEDKEDEASAIPVHGNLNGSGRHGGGWKKRGGWKTSRMTPLPKKGFWTPLVRYVFHPPHVSVLCVSCTEIHDRADQKLFWRGPKNFRESAFSGTFSTPHTFCTPPYHGPKWGLSKCGLGPKGTNRSKRRPFRGNSCSSPVAVRCGGISVPINPKRPRKGPILQEGIFARFSLKFSGQESPNGLSNGGQRPLPAICAQSCAIVHFRGLL